jgi:4-amino-4-deoxy-L-arabinose transferase-like glycosyltransferase
VAVRDGWRDAFVVAFLATQVIKFVIAARLSPFGDEAFYWMESRRLDVGYSDLPALTAWMIAAGEHVLGHGLLGMRLMFLLVGASLPWLLVALARQLGDRRQGWQAGLLALALPLAGSLGVLALPDVPLTVGIALATLGLVRAFDRDRWGDWCLVGAGLAIAWLAHYRAAMPMLAGLLLFTLTARGRARWSRPGFWLAMAIAALGLVPLVLYNLRQSGVGLAFQLVDRNPWQFHADALVQPLEQAVACTPLLYACLLWAAWQAWRRRAQAPWDIIATLSITFIAAWFVLGLFADDLRFRAHWPLPGYLPLLAVLPALWRGTDRRWVVATVGVAAFGLLACFGYLVLASSPTGPARLAGWKAFPANFTGWRETAASMGPLLAAHPDAIPVADNFMLAAELSFALDRQVFSLDSPLNTKHGRAPQLAVWRLDEAGLGLSKGKSIVLAVDETSLRERERLAWWTSLCSRVQAPVPAGRLDLFGGRKRIAYYTAQVPQGPTAAVEPTRCVFVAQAVGAATRPGVTDGAGN